MARRNSKAVMSMRFTADYFRRVREMAATGLVDCLAHLDLVKIHGHRPGAEIGAIVNETLDFIRARNLAIELSTAGWRKPVNELYPGDRIIELAIEKGISFHDCLRRALACATGRQLPQARAKDGLLWDSPDLHFRQAPALHARRLVPNHCYS